MMKIKAKYKNEVVYIIGFSTGSGYCGLPQEKAIIAIKTYRYKNEADIEAVDLSKITIIDEDYIPKGVEVK